MAIPRATCARKSWDSFYAPHDQQWDMPALPMDRYPNKKQATKRAHALLDSKGFDESNVNEVDSFGKTMLMRFCQYYDLTKALLEKNTDPNLACRKGCTALHYISTSGYEYDAYEDEMGKEHESGSRVHSAAALIEHGATLTCSHRNALGFTPLMYAAHNDRVSLVEYFLTLDCIPRIEKINALELLGAKQLLYTPGNGVAYYDYSPMHDMGPGFNRLKQGMKLRYKNPNEPCLKQCSPQKLYNGYAESRTMKELLKIRNNGRALRAEAYSILLRLIPKEMMIEWDPDSQESDWNYGSFDVAERLARCGNWEEGMDILDFLISLHVESGRPDAETILRAIQSYLGKVMDHWNVADFRSRIPFSDIQRFLQIVVDIVINRKTDPTYMRHTFQYRLVSVAWITYALMCLYPEDEVFEPLIQLLGKLVLWKDQSPENTAIDENDSHSGDAMDGRYVSVIHAFMESAFNHSALLLHPEKGDVVTRAFCRVFTLDGVNAVNKVLYSSPVLHRVVESWHGHGFTSKYEKPKLELLLTAISLLIRHGFSCDQTDSEGHTISQVLSLSRWSESESKRSARMEALELIESLKRCDLQELAARVIRNYHIPYRGIIPKPMYKVIEME